MIVFDDGLGTVVKWNESATFNVFFYSRPVDCFTIYYVHTPEEAAILAAQWVEDNYSFH